jgi:hypothetical protein
MTPPEQELGIDLFLTAEGDHPRLRIGLVVDGVRLPSWKRSVIEKIQAAEYTEIVCLLDATDVRHEPRRWWRDAVFRQYVRLDRALYGSRRAPDPDQLADCRDLLGAIPSLALHEAASTGELTATPADGGRLTGMDLDVVIDLGTAPTAHPLAAAARHGVWRCHFGPGADEDESRAGYAELATQSPATAVSIRRRLQESASGDILASASTTTAPGMSRTLNRFEPLWMAAELVIQALHRLHRDRGGSQQGVATDVAEERRGAAASSNWSTLRFLAAGLARKVRQRIRHPHADLKFGWLPAVRRVPDEADGIVALQDSSAFRWLTPQPGSFWADPFLLERDGRTWLFLEEYLYAEERGVISVGALDDQCSLGPLHRIIDSGGHLSYPHVFEDGEDVFLLPESADRLETTLYRAVEFPHRWEVAGRIGVGMRLLDTTVLRLDGLYWIFTSIPGQHQCGYTVLLFWAESLTGKWHHHPASPISRDIRYARGAGRIVRSGGRLFRPVQDGAGGYGRRVHFFEILELDTETFREKLCGTLHSASFTDAPAGVEGIHTYNRSAHYEAIDGVRLQRPPARS